MADDILQNTLSTPATPAPPTPAALIAPTTSGATSGKSLSSDIKTLQGAQKSPEMLLSLQKALTVSSQLAYRERQKTELESASQQFDPTKVSGGTFASILGNLEQQRGTDVSRIYAATLSTYANVQEQITNRLQFLQQLKQAEDHFKAELKLRKAEMKNASSLEKKKLKQTQNQWEAEFALARSKANASVGASSVYGNMNELKAAFSQMAGNSSGTQASFDPNAYLGIK